MCELYFSLRGEKQRDLMKRRFGILARLVQLKRFLPTPASVAVWVNRWTFSPPPPPPLPPPLPSNLQICQRPLTKTWFQRPLTIETENAIRGGGGAWVFRCDAILFLVFRPEVCVISTNKEVFLAFT